MRWKDVPIYGDDKKRPDFEVLLFRDGSIEFHYNKVKYNINNSYVAVFASSIKLLSRRQYCGNPSIFLSREYNSSQFIYFY